MKPDRQKRGPTEEVAKNKSMVHSAAMRGNSGFLVDFNCARHISRGMSDCAGHDGSFLQQLRRPLCFRRHTGDRQQCDDPTRLAHLACVQPPIGGETVTGRPLLNLSLAINYAISGLNVWSYHAVNFGVHVFAALLLFGILRRTFQLSSMREQWGIVAAPLFLL